MVTISEAARLIAENDVQLNLLDKEQQELLRQLEVIKVRRMVVEAARLAILDDIATAAGIEAVTYRKHHNGTTN